MQSSGISPLIAAHNLELCPLFAAVPQLAVVSRDCDVTADRESDWRFGSLSARSCHPPSIVISCLELSPLHHEIILGAGPIEFRSEPVKKCAVSDIQIATLRSNPIDGKLSNQKARTNMHNVMDTHIRGTSVAYLRM